MKKDFHPPEITIHHKDRKNIFNLFVKDHALHKLISIKKKIIIFKENVLVLQRLLENTQHEIQQTKVYMMIFIIK